MGLRAAAKNHFSIGLSLNKITKSDSKEKQIYLKQKRLSGGPNSLSPENLNSFQYRTINPQVISDSKFGQDQLQ